MTWRDVQMTLANRTKRNLWKNMFQTFNSQTKKRPISVAPLASLRKTYIYGKSTGKRGIFQ